MRPTIFALYDPAVEAEKNANHRFIIPPSIAVNGARTGNRTALKS